MDADASELGFGSGQIARESTVAVSRQRIYVGVAFCNPEIMSANRC